MIGLDDDRLLGSICSTNELPNGRNASASEHSGGCQGQSLCFAGENCCCSQPTDRGAGANQSLNRTDVLIGGPANDVMFGLNGNDVMDGGPGRDIILGGPDGGAAPGGPPNSDIMFGGPGNDVNLWAPGITFADLTQSSPAFSPVSQQDVEHLNALVGAMIRSTDAVVRCYRVDTRLTLP